MHNAISQQRCVNACGCCAKTYIATFLTNFSQEYYPNEAAFKSGQKPFVIRLNAFFVAAVEGSTDNEFTVSEPTWRR